MAAESYTIYLVQVGAQAMRTVVSNFASGTEKFSSNQGDSSFLIIHDGVAYTVDVYGNVLSPVGGTLAYCHSDPMQGIQSGINGTVKDFLTVSPDIDSPASKLW